MQPLTDGTRFARVTLAGDLLALVAFCVAGLSSHGEDVSRFFVLAAIFLSSWLLVAWAIGTYREFSPRRVVVQIVIAIVLGVAVRTASVGGLTIQEVLTFAAVAVVFCAFFVGIARLVTTYLLRGDSAP